MFPQTDKSWRDCRSLKPKLVLSTNIGGPCNNNNNNRKGNNNNKKNNNETGKYIYIYIYKNKTEQQC